MTLGGPVGELRAGGRLAARLVNWVLTREAETLGQEDVTVTAESVRVIDFYRAQHDVLDLWLGDGGRGWWVWRQVRPIGETAWKMCGRPEARSR